MKPTNLESKKEAVFLGALVMVCGIWKLNDDIAIIRTGDAWKAVKKVRVLNSPPVAEAATLTELLKKLEKQS